MTETPKCALCRARADNPEIVARIEGEGNKIVARRLVAYADRYLCNYCTMDAWEQFRPQDGKSVAVSSGSTEPDDFDYRPAMDELGLSRPSTERATPYTLEQIDAVEKALHPGADAFVDAPTDLMRNWRRRLLATARQGLADSERLDDLARRAEAALEFTPYDRETVERRIANELRSRFSTTVRRQVAGDLAR
jgi:hypothetical protein